MIGFILQGWLKSFAVYPVRQSIKRLLHRKSLVKNIRIYKGLQLKRALFERINLDPLKILRPENSYIVQNSAGEDALGEGSAKTEKQCPHCGETL